MKEMCGVQDSERVGTHKETAPSRLKRDEEDVVNLLSTITNGLMTNPFSLDGTNSADALPLINIATGVVMPLVDAQRLLQCHELGLAQMDTFVADRIQNTHNVLILNTCIEYYDYSKKYM